MYRLQEEQLRLNNVCRIVIDRRTQEDDAVHHKTRKDIHRSYIELTLLDDCRRDISRLYRIKIMQLKAAYAAISASIFFKFVHIRNFSTSTTTYLPITRQPNHGFFSLIIARYINQDLDSANITPRVQIFMYWIQTGPKYTYYIYVSSLYVYYISCANFANSSADTDLFVTLIFDLTYSTTFNS